MMERSEVQGGMFLSWKTWCGVATVKVVGTGDRYSDRISYEDPDGYPDQMEETNFLTWAYLLRNVRAATPDEISEFHRIREAMGGPRFILGYH